MHKEPDEPVPVQLPRGSLLVIFLTVFIDLLGFGIVLPLLPLYADQFSTDPGGWVIGLLMASFSLMQFLCAPFWGSLSDRLGRRPIIMVGLLGSVVFYTLFGIAAIYQSLAGLFAARIGAGIAGATLPAAQAYIADTTSKEDRARGMALIGMAFGLGFTLGPLFAYLAVFSRHQSAGPGPGFLAAGLSLIALLCAIFLLPESLNSTSAGSPARRRWDTAAWRETFSNVAISILLMGFFVCIFSFANFETTLSLVLKGSREFSASPFNLSMGNVCLTFAFTGFLVALVQGGLVRPLSRYLAEKYLAIGGALIEVAGFALVALAIQRASLIWLFTSLTVVVIGYAGLQPSLYSLLSRWSDPAKQGAVLGVGQSVSALGRILGSALGIPMLRATLSLPYLMASGLMLLVAALVFYAGRHGQDYNRPQGQ